MTKKYTHSLDDNNGVFTYFFSKAQISIIELNQFLECQKNIVKGIMFRVAMFTALIDESQR